MDDQVGLENKPPPLPKKNNIPAAARGSGMVLQQLDDATRLEKNAGANDEAKGSVEEGEICSASTVQRIPRAMKILKMRSRFNTEDMDDGLLLTCSKRPRGARPD